MLYSSLFLIAKYKCLMFSAYCISHKHTQKYKISATCQTGSFDLFQITKVTYNSLRCILILYLFPLRHKHKICFVSSHVCQVLNRYQYVSYNGIVLSWFLSCMLGKVSQKVTLWHNYIISIHLSNTIHTGNGPKLNIFKWASQYIWIIIFWEFY